MHIKFILVFYALNIQKFSKLYQRVLVSVSRLTVCLPKSSSILTLGLLVFFKKTGTNRLWTGTYDFSQDELQDSP